MHAFLLTHIDPAFKKAIEQYELKYQDLKSRNQKLLDVTPFLLQVLNVGFYSIFKQERKSINVNMKL